MASRMWSLVAPVMVVVMLAVAAAAGCAVAPWPPPAPPRQTSLGLAISTRTLANGLRVIVVEDPKATEVQVTMRYQVGAIDDRAHPGMAHLVEHLMFQQVLDGQSLYAHLEDRATQFNGATTLDATTYVARAPLRELDQLLAAEAVRLGERCTTLEDSVFVREREVVITELKQRDQATEIYAALHRAIYPEGHAYRRAIGGSIDSVAAITREQACAFMNEYYVPGNAVLVISGNVQSPTLARSLDQLAARAPARSGAPPSQVQPIASRPFYLEIPVPTDEEVFVLAWPLPVDPALQVKVRAIAAAVPRLIDEEIKGGAIAVELGDRGAPMLGVAVVAGDGESYLEAAQGARRAIEKLPELFRSVDPSGLDEVVFERLKQGAIYQLYSSLADGSSRDARLAGDLLAGRDPSAAVAAELAALERLTREEGAWLAAQYLASTAPTGIRLMPREARKRGKKVTLRAPIHDLGQRRTPPDPALAQRPADADPDAAARDRVAPRTRVLPNGLKVVLLPAATVPTFDARLIFGSGTSAEPAGQRGVALLAAQTLTWDLHFLADLVPFARAGGMRDTDVSSDRTMFSVQGLDMNLDFVLGGLRRWVREGTYDDSAASFVTAMRGAAKRADDQGALTDAWRAALFGPSHPYVQGGIVRHANHALTLADAARFRATHHTPGNATLVITGRFDPELADRWIDYLFADWTGPAPAPSAFPVSSQPASLAKVDDFALLQLRIALPAGTTGRAKQLVAAAMLDDIAHDVRHRLGASYSLDAQLAETRLASFFAITGWVDAARATEAIELIRDRIDALRTTPGGAASAFVTARRRVLTRLRSQTGSVGALAARIEEDIELARPPLSDFRTAADVQSLTLADMAPTLDALDLARAAILMNGPGDALTRAFAALQRTPVFITPAAATTFDAPGATPPALAAAAQRVPYADLQPSLTTRPPPRLLLTFVPALSGALLSGVASPVSITPTGLAISASAGYRVTRRHAVGGQLSIARLSADQDLEFQTRALEIVPINALGFIHAESRQGLWGELLLGLLLAQVTEASSSWRAAPLAGLHVGRDFATYGHNRLGFGFRLETTLASEVEYTAMSIGLVYRR